MFNGNLFNFQTKHEENLLSKCADHEEMVLYAPTGSGKTVMVCKFIDDYLDDLLYLHASNINHHLLSFLT